MAIDEADARFKADMADQDIIEEGALYCANCEDYVETQIVCRDETYTVKGRKVTVPVTLPRCVVCDEQIATDQDDQDILDAIHAAAEGR